MCKVHSNNDLLMQPTSTFKICISRQYACPVNSVYLQIIKKKQQRICDLNVRISISIIIGTF